MQFRKQRHGYNNNHWTNEQLLNNPGEICKTRIPLNLIVYFFLNSSLSKQDQYTSLNLMITVLNIPKIFETPIPFHMLITNQKEAKVHKYIINQQTEQFKDKSDKRNRLMFYHNRGCLFVCGGTKVYILFKQIWVPKKISHIVKLNDINLKINPKKRRVWKTVPQSL